MDCDEELQVNIVVYVENCCLMLVELFKVGFECFVLLDGVFYVYVDVLEFIEDSCVFVFEILDQVGVVVMLGFDFDFKEGYKWLWFLYVCSIDDICEGLICLVIFMQGCCV